MKELRPYQEDAVTEVFKQLSGGVRSQLVCFATGMGKTLTAAHIINKFPGRCLWITHSEELIDQSAVAIMREEDFWSLELAERIIRAGGIINWLNTHQRHGMFAPNLDNIAKDFIGVIKQERMDLNAKCVVASIQTLWRRLDKIPFDHFDVIIVDEAHYCMAKTWLKALEHFTPKLLLGLTATPRRLDGQSLGNIFEKITVEKDIKYGIDNGYLCELDAIRLRTDLNLDKVGTRGGEFKEDELEKLVDTPKRNNFIVDSWLKYAKDRQSLFACVTVQHAMNLCATFNARGVKASFIVGDEKLCPNRKERMQMWKEEEITVMCHVMVLTAGVDYPDISCVGMVRPTKSLTVYLQNIGRGTRQKPGRFKNCIILDVVDSTSRHQLVNAWELDKEKPIEERTFISKEKKEKLLFERRSKVERLVKTTKHVDLFKLPKMKVITSERMKEPATEAQLNWIKEKGYDIVNNEYTKAMCAEIISNFEASEKQKYWLKVKGYDIDVTQPLTLGVFQAAKNEIDARENEPVLPDNVKLKLPFYDLKVK